VVVFAAHGWFGIGVAQRGDVYGDCIGEILLQAIFYLQFAGSICIYTALLQSLFFMGRWFSAELLGGVGYCVVAKTYLQGLLF